MPQTRARAVAFASRCAWAALALAGAYEIAEPMRLLGAASGLLDLSLQVELLESPLGTATMVRVLGLALVAVGCRAWSGSGSTVAVAGGALVAASFAFMGHTLDHD